MPRSHRFFRAIRYLLSPRRSSQRRQKASVPKFSLITFSRCLALGSLQHSDTHSRKMDVTMCSCYIIIFSWGQQNKPDWHMSHVEVFHVVGALHVVVDRASSCATKCLNGVSFTFLSGIRTNMCFIMYSKLYTYMKTVSRTEWVWS